MAEQEPGNIFDEAGKQQSKPPFKKKKGKRPVPIPDAAKRLKKPKDAFVDDEVKGMFERMREIQESIQGKMLDIFEKSNLPQEKVQQLMEEPEKLPKQQKEYLDKEMEKLENEFVNVLGKRAKTGSRLIQEKKKQAKRKKKFLGKRRDWLEM